MNKEENKQKYIEILRSVKREGMDKLIDFLTNSTFFDDPASAVYHSNFAGGLCQHSLNVYAQLKQLVGDNDTVKVVALLHDICKIGNYETYSKNVKDEKTGNWNSVLSYRCKPTKLPFGHGEKSAFMAQQFIKLNKEEALAIRWHMGAYEPKEMYGELKDAITVCPFIIYVHAADMLATYVDEKVV